MSSIRHLSSTRATKCSSPPISRQRTFLLLELLIALFLTTIAILPLAEVPLKALRQEIGSLYRHQAHRLADLGFAKVQEALWRKEIPWDKIKQAHAQPLLLFEDTCTLSLSPSESRSFIRRAFLKGMQTKVKNQEEWSLMIARIEIEPEFKKGFSLFKGRLLSSGKRRAKEREVFAYYVVLHRSQQASL